MMEQKRERKQRNQPHAGHARESIFAGLTRENLVDDRELYVWFLRATASKHPPVNQSEADLLFVFRSAERALRVAGNPPAMFASLVGKRLDYASGADEERALARLRRMRKRSELHARAERT